VTRTLIRLALGLLFAASVALIVSALVDAPGAVELGRDQRAAVAVVEAPDSAQFARAIGPWDWSFPADHGAHPAFQTEWWYYTGNLEDAAGRRFGYQFTVFRRALLASEIAPASEWRASQAYMAHFTVTDVAGGAFFQAQRFSRGAAGLAGAIAAPRYRVWLDDWAATAVDDGARQITLVADSADAAVNLSLEQRKPPALHGDRGLSPKSAEPGNASYYYSLTRLATTGTIRIGDAVYEVSGASWMDHEFSTSALGKNAQGWDWFGLQLDDGRDLMLGKIRLQDGGTEPAFSGLLIEPGGTARYLDSTQFVIEATRWWTSPHTGATYPAAWTLHIDLPDDAPLTLQVVPLLADQELREGIVYWEGAVRVEGEAAGYGYAELTGYYDTMRNRF